MDLPLPRRGLAIAARRATLAEALILQRLTGKQESLMKLLWIKSGLPKSSDHGRLSGGGQYTTTKDNDGEVEDVQ